MTPRRSLLLVALPALLLLSACSSSSSDAGSSAAASPAVDLPGTSWTLTSYTGADGSSVAATAAPEAATLSFGAEGALSGSTGCNSFTGTYKQQLAALAITPGAMTQKACSGPVADQESAVLAALPKVASFTSEGALTLVDESGATLLVYAAAPTGLAGTSWTATGVNNGKEAVVSDATVSTVTATFGADGSLTGSGGCNQYTATYTTSGTDTIAIGAIGSTKMMCEDAAMATEQAYFAALAASTTYALDANGLTLRDASGATQVMFAPATG